MAEKKLDAGSIQIEDPLDFLTPAEKKEYIRAHQDTLLRSEEDPPVKKAYAYQDTRLHTDERRERTEKPKKESPAPRRRAEVYATSAGAVSAEDEVEETALDFMLSVAMKAFFAAILIVALIMAYMIYVRPLIRRATGLQRQAVETREAEEGGEDSGQGAGQEGTPRPEAPADGERVVTTTQLNLRTAPSTETGEVVTTVPAGEQLTRLSDDGEWSKVLFNGQELYCASAYLEAE